MENVPAVQELVEKLDSQVDDLEEQLELLLSGPALSELALQHSDPGDQAKIYMLYAYALSSILFARLKSSGVDTSKHPIMADLERIKAYMAKVKQATTGEHTHKKVVDQQAVNRIIKSAISQANFKDTETSGEVEQQTNSESVTPQKSSTPRSPADHNEEPSQKKRKKKSKSKSKKS